MRLMYISEQHEKGWLFIDIHESFFFAGNE